MIDYFKNFLSGRQFISSRVMRSVVDLRDLHRVSRHSVRSGVQQGSISGPVLTIMFIDEVLRQVPQTVAYADDLALVCGRESVDDLQLDLQLRFHQLQSKVESLRLTINLDKTWSGQPNYFACQKAFNPSGWAGVCHRRLVPTGLGHELDFDPRSAVCAGKHDVY